MKTKLSIVVLLALALTASLVGAAGAQGPQRSWAAAALRSSPVLFIENVGQFAPEARFQVRGDDCTLWLAEDALWVTVLEPRPSPRPPDSGPPSPLSAAERGEGPGEQGEVRGLHPRLTFPGANPHPRLEPFGRLETVVSYFIGGEPAQWRAAVPI